MSSRIVEVLHEEHVATVAFIDRLAQATTGPAPQPAAQDPATARLLRDATAALGGELGRHFDFEERPLFERLAGSTPSTSITALESVRPNSPRCTLASTKPARRPSTSAPNCRNSAGSAACIPSRFSRKRRRDRPT